MTSLESMIDVNTIVGDMVTTPDGTVIIPVSKVCFGFAAGGSEFNTNKLNKFSESTKLPFGGGSGAGVNIMPVAFLVVKDSTIRLLNVTENTTLDKIIDLVPEIMTKIEDYIDKKMPQKNRNIKDDFDDIEQDEQNLDIEQEDNESDEDDNEENDEDSAENDDQESDDDDQNN